MWDGRRPSDHWKQKGHWEHSGGYLFFRFAAVFGLSGEGFLECFGRDQSFLDQEFADAFLAAFLGMGSGLAFLRRCHHSVTSILFVYRERKKQAPETARCRR